MEIALAIEGGYGGGSFSRLTSELERTAITFGMASQAAQTFVSTVATFVEFDRQLRLTNSVADGTAKTFELLKNAAVQFSLSTSVSATQAASAMYYLASAGYTVKESVTAMTGVLLLQQATLGDTARVADLVVATLNQYGLSAKDAGSVADIFASSITKSQATLEKLSYAMRQVGPVAAYLGQEVRETTTWLSALFNAGLRGEQAGTALRNVLLRLVQPTENASSLMRALGVDVIDPITLKFRGLKAVMEDFVGKGLTAGAVKALVGDEAAAGFKIILQSVTVQRAALEEAKAELARATEGGDSRAIKAAEERVTGAQSGYDKLYAAIDPNSHEALRIARQNMESFDSQLKVVRNDITAFGLAVGESSIRALMPMLRVVGDLGKAFADLNPAQKEAIGNAAGLAAVAGIQIALWDRTHGILEKIIGLGFPKHIKQAADEIKSLGTAVTATNIATSASGLTQVSPGVRAPVSTPAYISPERATATMAAMGALGASAFHPWNYSGAPQTRLGTMGTQNNVQFYPLNDPEAFRRFESRGATERERFAEAERQGFARGRVTGEQAYGSPVTAGAAGGLGSRVTPGGVATGIIGLAIGAEIAASIYQLVKAYNERNVVHGPQYTNRSLDQTLEMIDRTMVKQGDISGAVANLIEQRKQQDKIITGYETELSDLKKGRDSNVVKDATTAMIADIRAAGASEGQAQTLVQRYAETGRLSRQQEWSEIDPKARAMLRMSGVRVLPEIYSPEIGEKRGTEIEASYRGRFDVTQRLTDTENALTEARKGGVKVNEQLEGQLRRNPEMRPGAEAQIAQGSEKEQYERLILTPELERSRRLELSRMQTRSQMAWLFSRGRPEEQFQGMMKGVYAEADTQFQAYLKSRVDAIKASPAGQMLNSFDYPTLLGQGGRPGTQDVSAGFIEILKSYGSPSEARKDIENIMKRVEAMLQGNLKVVMAGKSEKEAAEIMRLIIPEWTAMIREMRSAIQSDGLRSQSPIVGPGEEIPGTGGTRVPILKDDQSQNLQRMRSWLINKGYTPEQIPAVLGSAQVESSLNPLAGPGGAGERGLFQWNPKAGRLQGLESYAAGQGKPWTDLIVQMEFMDVELRKLIPEFFKVGQTAEYYNRLFVTKFENPAKEHQTPAKVAERLGIGLSLSGTAGQADWRVIGDSIGLGIKTALKIEGDVQGGRSPQQVLETIRGMGEDQIKGRDIILSSGLSNKGATPTEEALRIVAEQLKLLTSLGAKSIAMVGVGPGPDGAFRQQSLNTELGKVARAANVRFTGELGGTGPRGGIHPSPEAYKSLGQSIITGTTATAGALDTILLGATAGEYTAEGARKTGEKHSQSFILKQWEAVDTARSQAILRQAQSFQWDHTRQAEAFAQAENVKAWYDIANKQLEASLQIVTADPATKAAIEENVRVYSEDRWKQAQEAIRKQRSQLPIKELEESQKFFQDRLSAQQTNVDTVTRLSVLRPEGIDQGELAMAFRDQAIAQNDLKYKKELMEVEKLLVEYRNEYTKKPTEETKNYIASLEQLNVKLKEAYDLEQKRLTGGEAAAKFRHDALVKEAQAFEEMNKYSGDFFTGLQGGMKEWVASQKTMFDQGKEAFKTFADGISDAFADLFSAKGGPKKALESVTKMLDDLSRQLMKAFVDQALVKPLMKNLLGDDGGTGGGGSGGFSERGGSNSGGFLSGASGMVGNYAAKGLFEKGFDALGGLFGSSGPALTSGGTFFGDIAGAQAAGFVIPSASGNVFKQGQVTRFGGGGSFTNQVVDKPTYFPMAKGDVGLMGEAGPEAIIPLKRGKDGQLGIAISGMFGEGIVPLQRTKTGSLGVGIDEKTAENLNQKFGHGAAFDSMSSMVPVRRYAEGGIVTGDVQRLETSPRVEVRNQTNSGHQVNFSFAPSINMPDGGGTKTGGMPSSGRPDPRTAQDLSRQLHAAVYDATLNTIRNEQRPGGMLYGQSNSPLNSR